MRLNPELSKDSTVPKTSYMCRSCRFKFNHWERQLSQRRVQIAQAYDSDQGLSSAYSTSSASYSSNVASTSSASSGSVSDSSEATTSSSQRDQLSMPPPPVSYASSSNSGSTRRRTDLNLQLIPAPPSRREARMEIDSDEAQTPLVQAPTILTKYQKVECPRLSCVFGCRWPGRANARNLLLAERIYLLKNKNIYVNAMARICKHHDFFGAIEFIDQVYLTRQFTVEDIEDVFSFPNKIQERFTFRRCDEISDEISRRWTSLTMRQLIELTNEIKLSTDIQFPERAVACYLAKLRTGESWERIFDIIGIPCSTGYSYVTQARDALNSQFVPKYIGFDNITREDALAHNTHIASGLLADSDPQKLIVVCDGTYVYHQKSANFPFQRASYSPHKYRNLFKPMVIIATDGYILEVTGPYEASKNDSAIMSELMGYDSFQNFFQQNDIFVLDRGFRYVEEQLITAGFKTYMPSLLNKNQSSFTTEQANHSRIVTKVRYAVEDVNGRVKSVYRIFNNVWQNKALDHAFTDFRIACALLNKFGSRLESDKDVDFDIVSEMQRRNLPDNPMKEIVRRFKRYVQESRQWANIDGENLHHSFPVLTLNQLMHFTLGSYQIKQAYGYYAEHVSSNGGFFIQVYKDILRPLDLSGTNIQAVDPVLIRARIQSRHVNAAKYLAYVLYDKHAPLNIHYICTCKNGMRTIGCCAHIATVIWYLGYARHQESIKITRAPMSTLTVRYESDDEDD
ncbi:uncharacterized protein LOC107367154 [Tetranychus urticae]|nr:uncharacterized protein LOC107367154 [Tetranychus urticae]